MQCPTRHEYCKPAKLLRQLQAIMFIYLRGYGYFARSVPARYGIQCAVGRHTPRVRQNTPHGVKRLCEPQYKATWQFYIPHLRDPQYKRAYLVAILCTTPHVTRSRKLRGDSKYFVVRWDDTARRTNDHFQRANAAVSLSLSDRRKVVTARDRIPDSGFKNQA